jgi:hypothetical protein
MGHVVFNGNMTFLLYGNVFAWSTGLNPSIGRLRLLPEHCDAKQGSAGASPSPIEIKGQSLDSIRLQPLALRTFAKSVTLIEQQISI